MIYGYARVSTLAQCKNGNSLEEQTEALTDYGCDKIITETFTGKTTERPQFNELLQLLLPGDTLVVTKLVFVSFKLGLLNGQALFGKNSVFFIQRKSDFNFCTGCVKVKFALKQKARH